MEVLVLILIIWGFSKLLGGNKKKQKRLVNLNEQIAREENRLAYLQSMNKEIEKTQTKLEKYRERLGLCEDVVDLEKKKARAEKELSTVQKEIDKHEGLWRSMIYATQVFDSIKYDGRKLLPEDFDLNDIAKHSSDDLMCMQIKELRALYRANQKEIQNLVALYKDRYSSKTNATIYQLMVLALEAEMKNILHNLSFGKLQNAIDDVKALTVKYYVIATEGNKTITSTLTKFIGQLEYYYIEAVKIEYEYYVKRERAKEEQRALKEQMRQEAEERKQLEAQRKKMEAEEAKYEKEMERISTLLSSSSESAEIEKLRAQLEKVQAQLTEAQAKKEKIVTLQNGKAGTVYVISNIGAFGEDVFKIGMTRRDEPMDRIKELGDASVPFPFDVHSFIFSNDAVGLETKLHHILNNNRVNKINLRKEFFRVDIDRLQELVEELDPSAAFNRTALAEQFRQSLSIDEVPEIVDTDIDE